MPRFGFNVYVACSLTHASMEFRQKVEDFKQELRSLCNVLCFLGIDGYPPHEIYVFDIHKCVGSSDLVVAICDLPSIGLGYEMGTQIEGRKMPCLAIAHEDSLVSDLIKDIRQPGVEFRRYGDLLADGIELVADKLERMQEAETRRFPLLRLIQRSDQGRAVEVATA